MNKINYLLTLLGLFYSTYSMGQIRKVASIGPSTLNGYWVGDLVDENDKPIGLRVFIGIEQTEDGYTAKFSSPYQSPIYYDFDSIAVDDYGIYCEHKEMRINYGAKYCDGEALCGEWVQGVVYDLRLTRTEDSTLQRPQTPQPPFDYVAEEVVVYNKEAKINLAGTLTLPNKERRYPAVVLISGSGGQDRNSTIMEHRSFWVIADYLTKAGFAVLRIDDRGVGASEGSFGEATTADFVTDIEAAVRFLGKHPNIDKKKIGLIGHSEGGMIAPMVATGKLKKKVAFMVLLAPPAIPFRDVILQQSEDILLAQGREQEEVDILVGINQYCYDLVIADSDKELMAVDIWESIEEEGLLSDIPETTLQRLGLNKVGLMNSMMALSSDWFRYALRMDMEYLRAVECPVFGIFGAKDLQVAAKENQAGLEEKLPAHPLHQYKTFDNLNHLFQHSATGLPTEYGAIEETFAPEVLDEMKAWLLEVTKPKK